MFDARALAAADEADHAIAHADVICCATTARDPLFDGSRVKDTALVIAVARTQPTPARSTTNSSTAPRW